ncbi:MAG TPA: glycosyltransferase family A protein [Candidatus Paceibacterota bacterium]|nr:glycosyltransferase family A protein [Candidatus Paceibacterota bacterium]
MKLSFVIPAHNEERQLPACLDAIMREIEDAPLEIEILVVDNASTDGTAAAAARYPGVRVVAEPHKGIVWARARGFAESTGDLVANIDSDNILPKGWLRTVAREFEKNPGLVCLSGPLFYYDLTHAQQFWVSVFNHIGFVTHIILRTLHVSAWVQGGNFVLRRNAWEKAGGFDTTIDFYGEDTDVGRRALKQGQVKFTFKLPINSSGRRLAHDGLLAMAWRYTLNYLWVSFTGRPFTRASTDVRRPPDKPASA